MTARTVTRRWLSALVQRGRAFVRYDFGGDGHNSVVLTGQCELLRPRGEAKAAAPAAYYKPSMFWSVSSRSKHPAEAALFVDFLANSQEAAAVLLTERGVPANTAIKAKLTGTDKAAAEYLGAIKVSKPPRVTPKGATVIQEILRRQTEQVLFGRPTPQQAAERFIAELQAEIRAAS